MKDYNYDYKGHCLTCDHYELTTNWHDIHSSIGFRCNKHGWQDPYDRCSSYDQAYRSNGFIEDCLKEFDRKRRYYIVTVCASILGLKEDCEFLTNFKMVCDNYLDSPEGEDLLKDYDIYGKMVSDRIYRDFMNDETSLKTKEMVEKEIKPILVSINEDVKKQNIRAAILKYIVLTRRLMTKYGIMYIATDEEKQTKQNDMHMVLKRLKPSKNV